VLARFLSSISSFCFIYALTVLFEFLRYFGFPNALLWSLLAWLNLWDFVRTFLDRASDCESRVFLVLIVVLSYAVLILFVRGALGVIGTFLFGFSNRIWGSHSPPSGRLSGPSFSDRTTYFANLHIDVLAWQWKAFARSNLPSPGRVWEWHSCLAQGSTFKFQMGSY